MSELRVCDDCRRHCARDAAVCPFCGATLVAPVLQPQLEATPLPAYGMPPTQTLGGRLLIVAVVAILLGAVVLVWLALTGGA